jgi:hypothetical protein
VDTYSGARPFKQRTFHLRIFTIESSETLIRIYRAYSQQEEARAHPQNPTERPAIHRSAYERIDLPPNRNERQIFSVNENGGDRWIVCSDRQARRIVSSEVENSQARSAAKTRPSFRIHPRISICGSAGRRSLRWVMGLVGKPTENDYAPMGINVRHYLPSTTTNMVRNRRTKTT